MTAKGMKGKLISIFFLLLCSPVTSLGGQVAGGTTSSGASGMDALLIKLGPNGEVQWQRTHGGTGDDSAYSVQQTFDDGYVLSGEIFSFGSGKSDLWLPMKRRKAPGVIHGDIRRVVSYFSCSI